MDIASKSSDGWMLVSDASYGTAHAQGNADSTSTTGSYMNIGQQWVNATAEYSIMRGGLFFDTSAIPDTAVIATAILRLYFSTTHTDRAYNIIVVSGADLQEPLVAADYGQLKTATASRGSISSTNIVTSAYNDITLNATGIAEISKDGVTKFGLRSSLDINVSAPPASGDHNEYTFIYTYEAGDTLYPLLVVTFDTLTVVTLPVVGITGTTATGRGNITDLGHYTPTAHGVCWNTTGIPTTADSHTDEGAVSSTGVFHTPITGLTRGTVYFVRAYATNSEGTSYGSQVTFSAIEGETQGVIAVVEERLHYVDAYGAERYLDGTVVS